MRPSALTFEKGTSGEFTVELDEAEDAFEVIYEQVVVQQADLSGESRPSKNARPDDLTYTKSDWSQGEGYKSWDGSSGHPSQKGFYRTASIGGAGAEDAVETYIPGQVSLGLYAGGNVNLQRDISPTGPIYLTLSGGNVWAVYDSTTDYIDSTDVIWGAGWTNVTSGMGAQTIVGPITPHHSGIFIAGARSGADGGLRRITTGGNTSWAAENASSPLAADNRVYYVQRGTTTTLIKRSGLDAAATGSTVYTINGVGSSYSGSAICMAAVGSRIYIVTCNDNESARLHIIEGDVGREVAVLDGLRIPAVESGYSTNNAFNRICVINGVVFIAGAQDISGAGTAGGLATQTRPRVDYWDGSSWGTAVFIDWRESQWGGAFDASCIFPGRRNELLIGTTSGIFRYDLLNGSVARYIHSDALVDITSGVYVNGRAILATGHTSIDIISTAASGSGRHVEEATIEEPISDFQYPGIEKVLSTLTIETEALASGTSVEFSILLDDTTTITTDASGTTLAHTTGTRTTFTLSDHDTERICRWVQPKVILKTSNTANTPILKKWVLTARGASKQKFYQFRVNGRGKNLTPTKAITGAKAMQTLRTLTENTSNRVVNLTPSYLSAPPPQERGNAGGSTSESVVIEAARFSLNNQGEGTATLRVACLPGRV